METQTRTRTACQEFRREHRKRSGAGIFARGRECGHRVGAHHGSRRPAAERPSRDRSHAQDDGHGPDAWHDRDRRGRARRRSHALYRRAGWRHVSRWARSVPHVDIAVDPLEGTNLCATGAPGSITVLAASEKGGLLHAPDCYMEKIVVGPSCKNAVELDAPVSVNLKNIARRLHRGVEDLVVMVLDRPRHEKLIADIRKAGARIKLIGDGDLSAGIAAAVIGTGVHAVMGSGGAPEGVITAAAIRCLNGYMQGRLVIDKPELEERIAKMGIKDGKKIYEAEDLAPGKQMIFAATGVTEGALLKGVRFFGEGTRTSSVILTLKTGRVRFIESIHLDKGPDVKVRFS